MNRNACLCVDLNSGLAWNWADVARRLRIRLPRDGETVQFQRDVRCADGDTGTARDSTSNIVHQLAILGDNQSAGNGPAHIHRIRAAGTYKKRAEKCGKATT